MVQVNTFDGGLATRVDPSLLPPNYAVELVNVDPNSAVLKPVLSLVDALRGFVGQKVIDFGGRWLPIDADSVEWNDRLFYVDGVNPPKVIVPPRPVSYELDGTTVLYPAITEATTYNLGIDKPNRYHPLNLRRIPLSLPAVVADPPQGITASGDIQVALVYYLKGEAALLWHTRLKKNSENKCVLTFSTTYSVAVYVLVNGNYHLIDFVRSDSTNRKSTVSEDSELEGGVSLDYLRNLIRSRVVRYTYTYFSDKTLYESPPIDAGVEFSVLPGDNVEVELEHVSDQRVLNLDVSHVRVYRQGINGSDYWLVKEVKLPPIPGEVDGAYVSFIDKDLLTNSSTLLNSIEDYAPPNNLKYLSEVGGIFIGMVGDEVRWSLRGEPNAFPPTNSVKLREEGTGILVLPNGILAFTRHLTYFITLSDDGLPQQQLVSESQGCLSHKTCKLAQNTPVWVSYDGICTLRNGRVEVISRNLLDRLTLTGIVQAVIFDERYFILHSKGILVLDLRSQLRFYTLDYPGTTDMVVSDGELYFLNGGLLKLPTGEQESMHYLSPVFTDNNHTTTKSYNKIFVRADVVGSLVNGDEWQGDSFIFKAYVNGVERLSKQITKYVDEMTVPMENRKGNSIQFEVIGKGTLYAIDTRFVGEPQDG